MESLFKYLLISSYFLNCWSFPPQEMFPIQELEHELQTLNHSLVLAQQELQSIKAELHGFTIAYNHDMAVLASKLHDLKKAVHSHKSHVKKDPKSRSNDNSDSESSSSSSSSEESSSSSSEEGDGDGSCCENVETMKTELEEEKAKIEKLEKSNNLWRRNFRIVNRTFAVLRHRGYC